jgi:hypothetical protein
MSKATEVMMQYVENLKRTYEKDHAELMEFKKLANQNSSRSCGPSGKELAYSPHVVYALWASGGSQLRAEESGQPQDLFLVGQVSLLLPNAALRALGAAILP